MRIYPYLRASTKEQDANRAIDAIQKFANEYDITLSRSFVENESGASLQRPKLFELLDTAESGDCILLEQVDRLSRLSEIDWQKLKGIICSKGINIVSLDMPTSWQLVIQDNTNEFTNSIMKAVNGMLLDMLAAVARKDYEDRKRRQKEGIAKAKSNGQFKGRPIDQALHDSISKLLKAGSTYSEITKTLNCSRATVAKVSKTLIEI
ncbi:recombinase family protein [Photobacterium lipolyticum]|uniref:Resolvase n=1 Tax=Photobacterium lipolyticum TaxID=266810 RepID=A0A2T3MS53_9GAMM|nr:recombinase family protein [Photobacterium lipolyticum]PSW00294.1 resolvase [Photobacterium lipolyticum]